MIEIFSLLKGLAPLNKGIHHTYYDVGIFWEPNNGVCSAFVFSTDIKPSTEIFLRPSCTDRARLVSTLFYIKKCNNNPKQRETQIKH